MPKKKTELLPHDGVNQILEAHARFIDSGGKEGTWADLSLYIINDFDFRNLELREVCFHNSRLIRCKFAGTELSGAILDGTHAPGTDFREAKLVKSEIFKAELIVACFDDAKLVRAMILKSNLSGATFRQADLLGAIFSKCDLRGVIFDGANLDGASFDACLIDGTSWEGVRGIYRVNGAENISCIPSIHAAASVTERVGVPHDNS